MEISSSFLYWVQQLKNNTTWKYIGPAHQVHFLDSPIHFTKVYSRVRLEALSYSVK